MERLIRNYLIMFVLLRQKVYLQLLNVVLTILLYLKFNDQSISSVCNCKKVWNTSVTRVTKIEIYFANMRPCVTWHQLENKRILQFQKRRINLLEILRTNVLANRIESNLKRADLQHGLAEKRRDSPANKMSRIFLPDVIWPPPPAGRW